MADRTPLSGGLIPRKGTASLEVPPDLAEASRAAPAQDLVPRDPAPSPPAPVETYPVAPVPAAPYRRSLTYRPTVEMHDWLREVSHRTGHSIQDLIDEALRRFRAGR